MQYLLCACIYDGRGKYKDQPCPLASYERNK